MTNHQDPTVLRARISALEELLAVHERAALDMTQHLELERARLQEIFENVPASVSIFTAPDWVIAYANSLARAMIERGDMIGKKLSDLFPETLTQGYITLLDDVLRTGEAVRADEAHIALETEQGFEDRYFNYSFVPIRDSSGDVVAVLSHSVEVTDIAVARRAVESLVDDLRRTAELSIAVNAELTVDGVIRTATKGAAEILEATRCSVELLEEGFGSDHDQDASHSIREQLIVGESDHIGTMLVKRGRAFTEAERAIAKQVARFTTTAIERARAYEREHKTAEVLQRSLLPAELPSIPGVTVVGRYRPGETGDEVGGDWYDVIPLPDGRVAFVLGDVGGKGVRAASIMGQIRIAVRAYALGASEPAAILGKTDRLLQGMDPDHMVTVLYIALDMTSGVAQIATAGHPPPVVHSPGAEPKLLKLRPAPPLGIIPHAQFHEQEFTFPDGTALLLYSDGLVERRGEPLDAGLNRLIDAVRSAPSDMDAMCDHVLGSLLLRPLSDDVAMLAFRVDVLSARPLEVEFVSAPGETPKLRALTKRWLRSVGIEEKEALDIVLACGEAYANACEHAYSSGVGPVSLSATVEDGTVVIVVRDRGTWRPPRAERWRGRGIGLMKLMMDHVDLSSNELGTTVTMRRRLNVRVKGATA